ncbi:MAG: alpha/beta hydrolase [Clostridiales bacterium]|nr:alpha/beta hydrolase [Clostridiales bacterium]
MPKLVSALVRAQIALLKPVLERMNLRSLRKLQDALGKLGTRALVANVCYIDEFFEEFEAAWARPTEPEPGKAILYLHGGSYTAGTLDYAKGFGGILAELTGRGVLAVGYRLAPEYPHPAALEDALEAYQKMLERFRPEDIAFAGESAGGGLCFCLCLKLKELGMPMPSRIVAISPWTDLSMDCARHADELTDPILSMASLRYSASRYAKGRLCEPLVSPLYGDLSGMPESMIIAGTDEILLNDSVEMARRLSEAGSPCELIVEESMWHVFVLYGIPEAKEALERIRAYVVR